MAPLRSSVLILVLFQVALCFSELFQASSSLAEGLGGGAEAESESATRPRLFRRSAATTPTPPSSTTQGKQRPRGPSHNAGGAPSAPDNSEPSLTCHAHCPRCPLCPTPPPAPAPVCPSPCAPCLPPPSVCAPCPTCPACNPRIPPGYEHHPNLGHYKLHLTPSTWMEAKDTCEREGAHLAIINSQAEADLMKQLLNQELLQPNDGKFLYLGFHDLYKEGKFMTVLGQTLSATGFTKWNPGQPDNAGNSEHCGCMYPSGGLNDLTCTRREIFVCEYPVQVIH